MFKNPARSLCSKEPNGILRVLGTVLIVNCEEYFFS